jgi:hypothetical protein
VALRHVTAANALDGRLLAAIVVIGMAAEADDLPALPNIRTLSPLA